MPKYFNYIIKYVIMYDIDTTCWYVVTYFVVSVSDVFVISRYLCV